MTIVGGGGGGGGSYLLRGTIQEAKTQVGQLRVPTRLALKHASASAPESERLFQMWVSWAYNLKSTLFQYQ